MVKENRIVFGLEDLKTIGIRCVQCKGEVRLKLTMPSQFDRQCPLCKTFWAINELDTTVLDALDQLMAACYRQANNGKPTFRPVLEIDGD